MVTSELSHSRVFRIRGIRGSFAFAVFRIRGFRIRGSFAFAAFAGGVIQTALRLLVGLLPFCLCAVHVSGCVEPAWAWWLWAVPAWCMVAVQGLKAGCTDGPLRIAVTAPGCAVWCRDGRAHIWACPSVWGCLVDPLRDLCRLGMGKPSPITLKFACAPSAASSLSAAVPSPPPLLPHRPRSSRSSGAVAATEGVFREPNVQSLRGLSQLAGFRGFRIRGPLAFAVFRVRGIRIRRSFAAFAFAGLLCSGLSRAPRRATATK